MVNNFDTFSLQKGNTSMTFRITNPFDASVDGNFDELLLAVFQALYAHINDDFVIIISNGNYTPDLMATELQNRFNDVVSQYILSYLQTNNPDLVSQFVSGGGYNQFVIKFNLVKCNLWFGNKSSGFKITNDSSFYSIKSEMFGINKNSSLPNTSDWGLPEYLGFNPCLISTISNEVPGIYPRFYYLHGDHGYWLTPDLPTETVYFLEAPNKILINGNDWIYMEIHGFNNIDELTPYALSKFSSETNEMNGVVNSAFAKLGIFALPLQVTYSGQNESMKIFNPPAERIKKIKIKFRYHDGRLVNFGNSKFSFTLIFSMLQPQSIRKLETYNLSQNLSYGTVGHAKR